MDTDLLFGLWFGLTIIPIAVAALLGEFPNEQTLYEGGFRVWARNLALRAHRSIVLRSPWVADMLHWRSKDALARAEGTRDP